MHGFLLCQDTRLEPAGCGFLCVVHDEECFDAGAPVVDAGGRLVGVLSKKDCLRAALNSSYYQEWGGSVADYMVSEVETLEADMELVQAAERFLTGHFRRFPVMRDGRLAGQISRSDVLRGLTENWW